VRARVAALDGRVAELDGRVAELRADLDLALGALDRVVGELRAASNASYVDARRFFEEAVRVERLASDLRGSVRDGEGT
jgi:hypothetical protein